MYKVELCEDLPRKVYTVRTEYWIFASKRAAKLKYKQICKENAYKGKYHKEDTCKEWRLTQGYNKEYYNIYNVELVKIGYETSEQHNVHYDGGYTI